LQKVIAMAFPSLGTDLDLDANTDRSRVGIRLRRLTSKTVGGHASGLRQNSRPSRRFVKSTLTFLQIHMMIAANPDHRRWRHSSARVLRRATALHHDKKEI
jgi:hypothetical protein